VANLEGMGTIPHALENVMAWKYGKENAVYEATKAFDRVISKEVPRIALVDYNNREVSDSLTCCRKLGESLFAVRVDTPGENVMQRGEGEKLGYYSDGKFRTIVYDEKVEIPINQTKYWFGTGVTVSGVYRLRKMMDESGFEKTKIILSSGFGKEEKVRAFVEAEEMLGTRLFDGLLVGDVFGQPDIRFATMDIVEVGEDEQHLIPVSKVGRKLRKNENLDKVTK